MQLGFNLPISGANSVPRSLARLAQKGEALGYDYLTVTDHVVLPDTAEPGYPYSESGAFYSLDSAHRHEMLTLSAWLARRPIRRFEAAPAWSAGDIARRRCGESGQLNGGRLCATWRRARPGLGACRRYLRRQPPLSVTVRSNVPPVMR